MRDRNLLRRDLLVIPGGLLTTYGFSGILFFLFARQPSALCKNSYQILLNSVCYNPLPLLLVISLLGIALLLVGMLAFRGRVTRLEGHLHAGTPTHFFLGFLISLTVLPAVAALVLRYIEGTQNLFVTTIQDTPVKTVFLLWLIALLGGLMLLPYAILLGRQSARRRRFLAEAHRAANEPDEEPEDPRPMRSMGGRPPGSQIVDQADWPESR